MITNDEILEIIDAAASRELIDRHRRQLQTDADYRRRFQFFESLESALYELPLESPSLRFTENILEKLKPAIQKTRPFPRWFPFIVGALCCVALTTALFSPASAVSADATPRVFQYVLTQGARLWQIYLSALSGRWSIYLLGLTASAALLLAFDQKLLQPYFRQRGLSIG